MFQLIDLFSLYHLRFVNDNDGQDSNYWSHVYNSNQVSAWRGYAYEQVCLIHIEQIKKSLGINGILSTVYSWKALVKDGNGEKKGGQKDLVIDRSDRTINVCEIKYSNDVYKITKEYAEKIRNKTSLFIESTKTKKSIFNTFITTYGVDENEIVDNNLTLEDLFV